VARSGEERGVYTQAITDVLRALATGRAPGEADGEGLRERKKRLTRQHISDTATLMFMERGFDEVRVAEIAAECGVSEKTVYNYFPTKESLVFDRTDELARILRASLLDAADGRTVVEAVTRAALTHVDEVTSWWEGVDRADAVRTTRRFGDMVDATPSLLAARHQMFETLLEVAAQALADRAGVSVDDPEPQLAALSVVGLWRITLRSMHVHADPSRSVRDIKADVVNDVRRAARLADAGLSSFDAAVRRDNGRQSVKDAAEAVHEARRQVVAAMKQAHVAWRQVKELHESPADARAQAAQRRADALAVTQRLKQEAKREALRAHADAQRRRDDARRAKGR